MAEIMRLTAYELERTLTLPRTALVFGILVAIVQASLAVIDTVAMQQAYEGASVLAGATAFDTFYMALNVEASTTLSCCLRLSSFYAEARYGDRSSCLLDARCGCLSRSRFSRAMLGARVWARGRGKMRRLKCHRICR